MTIKTTAAFRPNIRGAARAVAAIPTQALTRIEALAQHRIARDAARAALG